MENKKNPKTKAKTKSKPKPKPKPKQKSKAKVKPRIKIKNKEPDIVSLDENKYSSKLNNLINKIKNKDYSICDNLNSIRYGWKIN